MPEGDTIHRSAGRLRPALEGKPLVRFEAPRLAGRTRTPRPGTVVERVEAQGKHLLIGLGDGSTLRTHLGMSGSWHLYPTGARWRKPAHLARVVLEVEGWVAVCFSAPVVELSRARAGVAHLGPDLCRPDADVDDAVDRLGRLATAGDQIGPALLDQRVAAGIGNVYKSEVLFACGVDPFTPVERLDPATRHRLLSTAARLLRANLGSGPRATAPGGLAVYGRRGRPCRRCGTPVRAERQGPQARTTYWCPTCQLPR